MLWAVVIFVAWKGFIMIDVEFQCLTENDGEWMWATSLKQEAS